MTGDTVTHETPVLVRIWREGRRVREENVIAVETDGDEITLTTDEGEEELDADEWDELTVQLV